MSIIHGSWIVQSNQNYFFVWGEAWRSLVNADIAQNAEGDLIHPFALPQAELLALLAKQDLAIASILEADELTASWQEQFVEIPSIEQGEGENQKLIPLFTGESIDPERHTVLYDWLTAGFCLSPSAAIKLLQIVSLRSLQADATYIGGDLRFWCHIYRWSLDLIVRQKYLPGIIHQSSAVISIWQHLIDSEQDRVRLAKFSQAIPPVCLAYLDVQEEDEQRQAQELILRSLAIMIDARLRSWIDYNPSLSKDVTVQPWLQTLSEFSPQLELETKSIQRLENALYNWTLPIQEYLVDSNNNYRGQNQYRACFWLQPPAIESQDAAQGDWQLQYYLQALDEPEFRVAAATIWQCGTDTLGINGRIIARPQETLLKGLGLATRIYRPIATSLEQSQPLSCQLDPIQVYEFIRAIAWQLQNNGLGVILPPGLASGDNEQRLGIKITAEVARKKGERLSLQSLLKYKLEIAVGERTISQRDFKRLLAQKSPIVEVGGQWLALQPADVKAAQAVLDKSNEEMELSVEDALRLSTGDTKVLAKLPVVQFASTGVLAGLISNLTDNKTVEPIAEISGFNGQLRPYQAKGVGWLSFLETWGLGACLADDMGLGKCVLPDTKLSVNGVIKSAAEIWQEYSQGTEFDGEGYWSKPKQKLWVNSLDETTGKIVSTEIGNLYRQKISEKVVKINLEDGNSITITKRHKLLTISGWQNNLQVGDYVCVPSKLCSKNRSVEINLVKFVAWQIAKTNTKRIPASPIVAEIVTNTEQAEANYRKLKPSKWTQKTLAAYQQLDESYLGNKRKELQTLLEREVFYCRIKSIEEIDYEGWVYDFEIPIHHNFVANNIICHNTVQLIGFLLNLKQQDNLIKPSLLVCPTSVINNWEREVKKFAPDLKILIHHGDKRSQGKALAKQVKDKQLVVTSYSLVHRDLKSLEAIDWQNVVLDEAQNIKNPSAKQSQAVRTFGADFRVALTGTPVENRLAELWSILDFLNPGFLGTPAFFQKRFATPIEKYGDRDSLNILRSLVQPFILRRLKTDRNIIKDLPEKQEMNVFCGLSAEQAQLYEELVNQSLTEIEDSAGIQQKGLILTLLMRLKQLCNHPELIKPEQKSKKKKAESDWENFAQRSGKLLRLEEMLEETISEGDRSLIFTQFSEWGKMLQPYLEAKLGSEVLFLYGATRRQARQEMIDRFQHEPDGPKILILSLKAGGTGLNLTRANHVFHVDRWWNPAVENQATDRAFRIGQKRNVQVHKFVCTGTLEEKINDIIESKKELAEQTVNAGENWLTKLDTNKLRRLLLLDRDRLG